MGPLPRRSRAHFLQGCSRFTKQDAETSGAPSDTESWTGGYLSTGSELEVRLGTEAEDEYCLGETREDLVRVGRMLDHGPGPLKLAMRHLKVRTREGGISSLVANAVQGEFERRRGTRNIVLKARQMGLTTWVAARFFLRTITRPGTLTLQVAHTQEAAEEIFRIVHRYYQWLSPDLRSGPLKTSRANARQLVFPSMDSQYRVESAASKNVGRGMTVQNLHCSELARWPRDPGETLAGLRATLAPGAEMVLESTPYGIGGCFYDEWQRAGETGLIQHFFPWWMEEQYVAGTVDPSTYNEEERELAQCGRLTPEQIGFRRQLRSNYGTLAKQEYAEDAASCFRMGGDCYFDAESLEKRLKEVRSPVERRIRGEAEVWLPPLAGKKYVVCVDPAGGGCDGDYSAMEVVDVETGAQCAEFAEHEGGLQLARKAAQLAEEYNHAVLVVERNNHGSGVLAYLESDCHYDRVYEQAGARGWLTTSMSRPSALAQLGSLLAEAPNRFQSARFLGECRSFVRQANGNIGAQAGTHDDRVMAMAIAQAVRLELLGQWSCG